MLIKNVDIITENKPDEIIYGASILIKGDTIERIIKNGEPLPNDAEIIDGNGITTDLLLKNGIKVFGETQIEELFESLRLAKAPLQLSFAF